MMKLQPVLHWHVSYYTFIEQIMDLCNECVCVCVRVCVYVCFMQLSINTYFFQWTGLATNFFLFTISL